MGAITCGHIGIKNNGSRFSQGLDKDLHGFRVFLSATSPRDTFVHELSINCGKIKENVGGTNIHFGKTNTLMENITGRRLWFPNENQYAETPSLQ